MLKFCVAIILYNPSIIFYAQLPRYLTVFDKVILVDNSKYPLEQKNLLEHSKIEYLFQNGNTGMSIALKTAFSYAYINNFDFIATMDQDSEISINSLETMRNNIYLTCRNDIGAFCVNYGKKYLIKESGQMVYGGLHIPTNSKKFVRNCMTSGTFYDLKKVFPFLKFDNLFIGFVDDYISKQIVEHRLKIEMVGSGILHQEVGNTVENTFYNRLFHILNHTPERYYYMIRNVCYLKKMYRSDVSFNLLYNIKIFRILFNIIMGETNKKLKIIACYYGYKDFRRGKMGKISNDLKKKLH